MRNLFGDRLIPWSDVVDVSFPQGARWARVDLPDDEYIPVMAIQAVDKDVPSRRWTPCARCWTSTAPGPRPVDVGVRRLRFRR